MQVQVDIEFGQLIKMVRNLTANQLKQLMDEIEKKEEVRESKIDLETLLLKGPVATKKQIDTITNNRKTINNWRTQH